MESQGKMVHKLKQTISKSMHRRWISISKRSKNDKNRQTQPTRSFNSQISCPRMWAAPSSSNMIERNYCLRYHRILLIFQTREIRQDIKWAKQLKTQVSPKKIEKYQKKRRQWPTSMQARTKSHSWMITKPRRREFNQRKGRKDKTIPLQRLREEYRSQNGWSLICHRRSRRRSSQPKRMSQWQIRPASETRKSRSKNHIIISTCSTSRIWEKSATLAPTSPSRFNLRIKTWSTHKWCRLYATVYYSPSSSITSEPPKGESSKEEHIWE